MLSFSLYHDAPGPRHSLACALQALLDQLQDMVQDTAAFAQQQRADAERTKRSFSQVCLSWHTALQTSCFRWHKRPAAAAT